MFSRANAKLDARFALAVLVIVIICVMVPGVEWLTARAEHWALGVYPGIAISALPTLALPAIITYIAFRSLIGREILWVPPINSRQRPILFGFAILALAVAAAYPPSLSGMFGETCWKATRHSAYQQL
jgi:hypothetical protein